MKTLDRILQRWRIAKAQPYIAPGARLLDIGCADGTLLEQLKSRIRDSIGIDPDLPGSRPGDRYKLIAGWFPQDLPDTRPFDVITLLAVLEHVPPEQQSQLAQDCARFLKPGGHLIITVPAPTVDQILKLLKFIRLIDGMSLEQHYGFDAGRTPALFSVDGLALVKMKKFQLRLNNLFVFQKTTETNLAEAASPRQENFTTELQKPNCYASA
jgi:SAM-dependent methyltransferase